MNGNDNNGNNNDVLNIVLPESFSYENSQEDRSGENNAAGDGEGIGIDVVNSDLPSQATGRSGSNNIDDNSNLHYHYHHRQEEEDDGEKVSFAAAAAATDKNIIKATFASSSATATA